MIFSKFNPMRLLCCIPNKRSTHNPFSPLWRSSKVACREMATVNGGDSKRLLFRQLFEKESSTYTYLLADLAHADKPAVLIDPVEETVERDLTRVKELGLKLIYAMNTHVHADHVTGSGIIKGNMPGVKSVISKASCAKADHFIEHGDKLYFGDLYLEGGSAKQLYNSVHSQIFTLPKDTLIYPAHDYKGFSMSTVGEEMLYNPRLTKDADQFEDIMANLNLAYPKMIDVAVPANMVCGLQDISV